MVEAVVYSLCKVTFLRLIIATLYYGAKRSASEIFSARDPHPRVRMAQLVSARVFEFNRLQLFSFLCSFIALNTLKAEH